ncbi:MAG: Nif3-like dinuclear metal center hexameric protein [Clostridia bacterium]|nr:Nif3-like dinuclear metal center hexameric protein [Clostridia bacterium]
MRLSEIYKIADEIAPKRLSDEYCAQYGAYDNSGVLVDTGEEITGVVFSLDLTNAAIERAIAVKANLIICHHPAIYGKISDLRIDDPRLTGSKMVKCIKAGISVVAMHLNLDTVRGGIDEWLMRGVALAAGDSKLPKAQDMHPVSQGGYGKAYAVPQISLSELAENMKKIFSTNRILVYGNLENKITRVASCCGAGADEESILFAKKSDADVFISADFKHHLLELALENGMSVIVVTHYASENYGFEKYCKKICERLEIPCVYHTDNELL